MKKILYILLVLVLCSSCKNKMAVVEDWVNVRDSIVFVTRYHDSVVIAKIQKDSVVLRDSIAVVIDSTGKTTDRWHTYIKYVTDSSQLESYQARIDSLTNIHSKDSVVVKEVNTLTKWQKLQIQFFRWMLCVMSLFTVLYIVYRKFVCS